MDDRDYDPAQGRAAAEGYDAEATETGWLAPEVAFGDLRLPATRAVHPRPGYRLRPGGTTLPEGGPTGPRPRHLRGTSRRLPLEGLLGAHAARPAPGPYPFASQSFDHAACVGVLPFFPDLSPLFAETARLLRPGGMFVFQTLDRAEGEAFELLMAAEFTRADHTTTLCRHSPLQIAAWADEHGFALLGSLPFPMYLTARKEESVPMRCFVARVGRRVAASPCGGVSASRRSPR